MISKSGAVTIALLMIAGTLAFNPGVAQSMCCPIACRGCSIAAQGQINFVVMDRPHGRVRLIPNIRFTGNATDLALVVPTPTSPSFAPVPKQIWSEVTQLTLPAASTGGSGFFGCGAGKFVSSVPAVGGGVSVVSRDTVGGFIATVLTSDDPGALVRWLRDRDFPVDTAQASAFAPYIQRGWFFTAMKLDTSNPANQVPQGGWNASVAPVEVTFNATALEVPLPLIAINRDPYMTVTFYVVDDHRASLPGYTTRYANQISSREMAAIRAAYPNVAEYLAEGRVLTRMDHTYGPPEDMSASVMMGRASSDREVHWKAGGGGAEGAGGEFLLLVLLPWSLLRLNRGRRFHDPATGDSTCVPPL